MVNPCKRIDVRYFAERSRVNATTGCHEWTRHVNAGGYGTASYKNKHWAAHRLAWTFLRGPIPAGMIVCHRCDNRRCINPDHLFLGTTQDNVDDKMQKGRFVARRGSRSGTAKLTDAQALAIRLDTRTQDVIANEYGVSQATVSLIKQGKAWTMVPVVPEKRMTVQELADLFGVDYGKFRHHAVRQGKGLRSGLAICGVTL